MKNKSLFIFLLALLPSLSFSQISIDSFKVYNQGHTVDSIYIAGTTSGQSLDRVLLGPPFLDACSSTFINVIFKGCDSSVSMSFDTTLNMRYSNMGYPTSRVFMYTVWEPTAGCSAPTQSIRTDTVIWDICATINTHSREHFSFDLYPNPAQYTVQLELPAEIQVQRLSLSDVGGRVLRQYGPQQRSLEVTGLPPGLYFLRVESDRGVVVKRLVVE